MKHTKLTQDGEANYSTRQKTSYIGNMHHGPSSAISIQFMRGLLIDEGDGRTHVFSVQRWERSGRDGSMKAISSSPG